MSSKDNRELNARLAVKSTSPPGSSPKNAPKPKPPSSYTYEASLGEGLDEDDLATAYCQWTTHNGNIFVPASKSKNKLTPGVYEIDSNPNVGIFFERIPVKTEGLLRFPDTNSDKVVDDITKFWDSEEVFRKYDLAYKRGIILWGPPGSGKSCTCQLIMADVVKRGGIVVKFDEPYLFIDGMRILRTIQPDTPVVVMMEDIDAIIEAYQESEVLNILDGVNEVDKVVFLATTNYPDRLGARIVNRPSRFDKRFKIGFPSAVSRKLYFEYVIGNGDVKLGRKEAKNLGVDLKAWVKDTQDMSIAHLKELFIATVILGDPYDEAIKTLRSMTEEVDDKDYGNFGFDVGGAAVAAAEDGFDDISDWDE